MTVANLSKFPTDQRKQCGSGSAAVDDEAEATSKQAIELNAWSHAMNTTYDALVFLLASLGHIFMSLYYQIVGYPEKDVKGELALVTGGGGGLGRLLAIRLAKLGVQIVIWDINKEGIDDTVREVRSIGGTCTGYVVDISKKESVYEAAATLRREVGDITMLVNNAGVVSGRALLDTPDHLIERSFNVNILAHFWTTKAFLPAMLDADHGHIVTIASMAGHVGIAKLVDYCSSKFAAVGFDEALRMELESLGVEGVQTTCICPFFIQATGMFDDVNARWVPRLTSEEVADRVITSILRNEKYVILPSFLRIMLTLKWMFPWGCAAGFLSRIVPDAAPQHGLTNGIPEHTLRRRDATANGTLGPSTSELSGPISTEHELQKLMNNNHQVTPMLVKRTQSIGERVL